MDFFEAQDEARKKTKWLLALFLLCVIGVVLSIGLLSWGIGKLSLGGISLELAGLIALGSGAVSYTHLTLPTKA